MFEHVVVSRISAILDFEFNWDNLVNLKMLSLRHALNTTYICFDNLCEVYY